MTAGSAAFTLTVTGTNFWYNSSVLVGAQLLPASDISSTQLTILVSAGQVASTGTRSIVVATPTPGGGYTNAATLTITAPILSMGATTSSAVQRQDGR